MRLSANAPQLSKLKNKGWHVDSMLPDTAEIVQRAQGIPQVSFLQAELALSSLQVWQQGSQMALGGLVQSIGVPAFDVFKTLVKEFKIDPAQDVIEKLEGAYGTVSAALSSMSSSGSGEGGEAMAMAASAGVGDGIQTMTAFPIVGLVVRIAWQLGKLGVNIAKWVREGKNYGAIERLYPSSRFFPETDVRVLNSVLLDQVRTKKDWTGIFSPPALGGGVGTQAPYAVKRLDTGGVEIVRRLRDGDGNLVDWGAQGWLGFIPGTALLHSGISVNGQLVEEIGSTLFPSARGVAAWMWKEITAPNPLASIFAVDADEIGDRWVGYISQLHEFVDDTGALNTDEKAAVMRTFNASSGGSIFGWGTAIKPKPNEWDHYHPRTVADQLRARQLKACDTLLIAYVDEDFGAFRDPAVRSRFRQRRKDLLDHPAVCNVKLDSVIDADYKEALKSAGAGTIQCAKGPQWLSAGPVGPPFNPVDDTGSGGQGGEGGLDRPKRTSSRALPLLAAVTLAALGWHHLKKR